MKVSFSETTRGAVLSASAKRAWGQSDSDFALMQPGRARQCQWACEILSLTLRGLWASAPTAHEFRTIAEPEGVACGCPGWGRVAAGNEWLVFCLSNIVLFELNTHKSELR